MLPPDRDILERIVKKALSETGQGIVGPDAIREGRRTEAHRRVALDLLQEHGGLLVLRCLTQGSSQGPPCLLCFADKQHAVPLPDILPSRF